MDDFKEQLAAIRPKVAHESPRRSHDTVRRSLHGERRNESQEGEALRAEVLARLPVLGRIKSWYPDKGFGHIEYGRSAVFLHVKGLIPGGSSPVETGFVGQPVLFTFGTSPLDKEGARRAVQWCLVRDIRWADGSPPGDQDALDELRFAWLESQTIDRLLSVLAANWYERQWKEHTRPRNLDDEVLRRVLLKRLKGVPANALVELRLPPRFRASPYTFVDHWLLEDRHFQCWSFIRDFSPE